MFDRLPLDIIALVQSFLFEKDWCNSLLICKSCFIRYRKADLIQKQLAHIPYLRKVWLENEKMRISRNMGFPMWEPQEHCPTIMHGWEGSGKTTLLMRLVQKISPVNPNQIIVYHTSCSPNTDDVVTCMIPDEFIFNGQTQQGLLAWLDKVLCDRAERKETFPIIALIDQVWLQNDFWKNHTVRYILSAYKSLNIYLYFAYRDSPSIVYSNDCLIPIIIKLWMESSRDTFKMQKCIKIKYSQCYQSLGHNQSIVIHRTVDEQAKVFWYDADIKVPNVDTLRKDFTDQKDTPIRDYLICDQVYDSDTIDSDYDMRMYDSCYDSDIDDSDLEND